MEQRITRIPVEGGSANVPTGAIQFANDCPGLFIRGDDCVSLLVRIKGLLDIVQEQPSLKDSADLAMTAITLGKYAQIIENDVIERGR